MIYLKRCNNRRRPPPHTTKWVCSLWVCNSQWWGSLWWGNLWVCNSQWACSLWACNSQWACSLWVCSSRWVCSSQWACQCNSNKWLHHQHRFKQLKLLLLNRVTKSERPIAEVSHGSFVSFAHVLGFLDVL